MSTRLEQQLERLARDFLDVHWDEDWPEGDWNKVHEEFTKELDIAIADRWIEFRDRKNADLKAAIMDARPQDV